VVFALIETFILTLSNQLNLFQVNEGAPFTLFRCFQVEVEVHFLGRLLVAGYFHEFTLQNSLQLFFENLLPLLLSFFFFLSYSRVNGLLRH